MIVVRFDNVMTIDNIPMWPGVRYVVSEDMAQTMINQGIRGNVKLTHHSGFNNFERRLRPEAAKEGDIVAIWRHNAFGDNLMVTGLVAYMKLVLKLRVHVICAPHVMPVWLGMDKSIRPDALLPTPVYFDAAANFYDWHVFYQAMLEENREPDQICAVDDLWQFAGFDKDTRGTTKNFRRPLIKQTPLGRGEGIGISLHSGNCTRTMPIKWTADLITALYKKFPNRKIHVFGLDAKMGEELDSYRLPVSNYTGKISFEKTMEIMEQQVGTMISPDSALLHLAEGLGIPNIGLWGLFNPNDRTEHYRYHTGISNFSACPHAPCRWHGMNKFPEDKCGVLQVPNHCNALSSIPIEKVVEAV